MACRPVFLCARYQDTLARYQGTLVRYQGESARHQGTLATASPRSWEDIPGPTAFPIIGNLHLFVKKENSPLPKLYGNLKKKYGPVYKTRMFGDTFLNIHHPEDVRTVLANDGAKPIIPGFDNFIQLRKNHSSEHFGETTGLMAQGDEWYGFRRAVQQDLMRPKSALYYIEDIESVAAEFTDKVLAGRDEKGYIDIGTPCKEFSLDAIALIFLGGKIGALAGSEDADELIQRMDFFMKYAFFLFMCPTRFVHWLPIYKPIVANGIKMSDLLAKQIEKAKESIDIEDGSVLAKLMKKHGRDSKIPVVMGMDAVAAGIDTTGNSAALLLYHLARNQDKQEILHQEIISVLGKDGPLSSSSLAKMRYLKACQQESARLLPITSGIIRETQVPLVLGGYDVPPGSKVLIHSSNNCEESFRRPEVFLPERWIRGHVQEQTASAFANLPFSHGPRSCIGQRFAKLELYVMLAKLLQRCKIEYQGEEINIKSGVVGAPDKPVLLRVTQR